ncbi:MAG: hypothetical protein ACRCU5_15580 [Rhizobiaceae bacterium]
MTESASKIDEIWSQAVSEIATHWFRCEESGLDHTISNRDEVLAAFVKYTKHLKSTPFGDAPKAIEGIRILYSELNLINEEHDLGLLETDERELLVPIIIELAAAAGVNPDDYDGEPGSEYRDF